MGTKLNWARVGLVAALLLSLGAGAHAVNIDWVTVGDAGNAPDNTTYGAVDHSYRISKYEITAGQYTEFLSAKAASDPNGLYHTYMWTSTYGCKIERTGSPGSYTYSVASDRANRPVNYMTFWDIARFANWMHNGQGSGDTETGAYTGIGNQAAFARQPGALFFMPTEDEWYKAAYYKGGGPSAGYWQYPTKSETAPSNALIDPDPGNNATFWDDDNGYTVGSPYYCTEVGAHENSASACGTFDQGGNLWEWNETAIGAFRGVRGGSRDNNAPALSASARLDHDPSDADDDLGFRLAGPLESTEIPEPATVSLLGIAVAAMLRRMKRST